MKPEELETLPYRPNAGVMLVNDKGHVFVGQRLDNPGPAWQMPQGGMDEGESAEEAALRELTEETGVPTHLVKVEAETEGWITYDLPQELLHIWKHQYRGQKQKWFLMRFLGQDSDVNIETDHPEFSEWKWMPAEQLIDNIVPFKREVYARVLKEFGDVL